MSDNEFQADEFQTPDAPADVTAEEIVDKADDKMTIDKIDKVTPNQLGDLAMKFASETAYAARAPPTTPPTRRASLPTSSASSPTSSGQRSPRPAKATRARRSSSSSRPR